MKPHSSALVLLTIAPLAHSFGFESTLRSQRCYVGFNAPSVLHAISKEQIGVLDGSNYNALDLFSIAEGNASVKGANFDGEKIGIVNLVVGTLDENPKERIVGIVADPNEVMMDVETVSIRSSSGDKVLLYKDSVAKVPKNVSDEDAISTSFVALTGVHCAYHDPIREDEKIVQGIGGSEDSFILDSKESEKDEKKCVVLGGGDYAIFVSDSLASLGGDVTQITTNKLLRPRKQSKVSVSPPGIGDEEFSFSSVMNFDILVDSLSDETKLGEAACRGLNDDTIAEGGGVCSSAVIKLLQKQNKCKRYISTMTSSQKKVQDDGIIWGRTKAIKFGKDVVQKISSSRSRTNASSIGPPKRFSDKTLQPILNAGIVYKSKSKDDVFALGWNMQDFWEQVSWPRDSENGNVRFGFPVVVDLDSLFEEEEEEEEEGRMISAPPKLVAGAAVPKMVTDEFAGKQNPYVMDIEGLKDLNGQILNPKKDCVLFLSAAYCRTCRYLTPQYTKLARSHANAGSDIIFAKSNAVGKVGKDISKALGVDAVPAFCFFKKGKRYGSVVSVAKMPSKKLDLALNLLASGAEWDRSSINALK